MRPVLLPDPHYSIPAICQLRCPVICQHTIVNFLIPNSSEPLWNNQYESMLLGCTNMESEILGIQREQHRIMWGVAP